MGTPIEAQQELDGATQDLERSLLIEAIYRAYHYDFREYAQASLKRRLGAALTRLQCRTLSQLQDRVLHDPCAFPELLNFLTISVSDLFRDPAYFLALREQVVPRLRTYPSLRIWVAGCSTGEEAYSIAILLLEEQLLERTLIYATDINPESLARARAGIYAVNRVAQFTQNHRSSGSGVSLSNYYTAAYEHVVMQRQLREHIVFCDHSLATDNVFAEVQLVSCRNVLIYFNRALQDRALGLFREALCSRGFLGLGAKESLHFPGHAAAFEPIALDNRIYRKREAA